MFLAERVMFLGLQASLCGSGCRVLEDRWGESVVREFDRDWKSESWVCVGEGQRALRDRESTNSDGRGDGAMNPDQPALAASITFQHQSKNVSESHA